MAKLWAGIDAGKRTHHLVLIDGTGNVFVSQKVANEESDLLDLLATVFDIADGREVCWATDLTDGGAALVITLLTAHDQQVLYIPGGTFIMRLRRVGEMGRLTRRTPGPSPIRPAGAPTCRRSSPPMRLWWG